MKKLTAAKSKLQYAAAAVFLAFLAAVTPLLLIARYDHPSADDFTYGLQTARALAGGGSFLSAACHTVRETYYGWQGSFAGVFVMAVQPAAFGERFYFLAPLLVLAFFMGGTLFLLKTLLRGYLRSDRSSFLITGFVVLSMSLNFLPSPVEGIYWYNGASYYTGFYSVSLIVFALVLRFFQAHTAKSKILNAAFALALSFFIGGGNYTTALETALVLTVLTFLALRTRQKKNILLAAGSLALNLAGLAVSAAAPGNAFRKQHFTKTPDAVHAILDSFRTALHFLYQWTTPTVVICLLFLAPLLYRIVRSSGRRFPPPVPVLALSFCMFAAQFTPPLYALGSPGPDRLVNIVYFSYYWLLLVNLTCAFGWAAEKFRAAGNREDEPAAFAACSRLAGKHLAAVMVLFAVLLAASCIGSGEAHQMTSVSAARSLQSGQAAQYDREANDRLALYRQNRGKDLTVQKFSARPYVLCFNDIDADSSNWRNQAVSQYYGLKSVRRSR